MTDINNSHQQRPSDIDTGFRQSHSNNGVSLQKWPINVAHSVLTIDSFEKSP